MPLAKFMPTRIIAVALSVIASLFAAGCSRPKPDIVAVAEPEVIVELPTVDDDVTDYEDFTGRTAASKVVAIKAHVTGYLAAVRFKDGELVHQGQALFDIEPGLYVPELERAKATVEQSTARVTRLERDFKRSQELSERGAISQEDKDRVVGDLAEARAALKVSVKQQELAQTNVDYLHISAPISGRISTRNLDAGNLVKADDTLLTTIYATDPIYVYFDIDDRTELRVKRLIADGSMKANGLADRMVKIGLPDNESYALDASITFEEPQFNPGTGTKRFRAELSNSKSGLLSPGLFVRVRVPIGQAKRALLVPEEAIATDQTQKYVFVVNDENKVVYKPVVLGIQWGRFRVIETTGKDSLQPTDRVIVSGLQRVRAGVKVQPKWSSAKPATKVES